ncbi:MAG: class I SAM-dependent methyltransferase [Candidatus Hydrothermarchaeota archaeon]
MTMPSISRKSLESFYSDEYYRYFAKYFKKKNKILAFDYFRKLKKFFQLKKASSFLELGGGYGFFSNLVSEYFRIKVDMIELSKQGARYANENFKNVNVIEGSLESSATRFSKRFDVVFSGHLLEHLVSLRSYFSFASKLVKENGHILMFTPNADSLRYRIFRKYWGWAAPREHINFISQKGVRLLAKEYGLEIEILKSTIPHLVHYPSFLGSILRMIFQRRITRILQGGPAQKRREGTKAQRNGEDAPTSSGFQRSFVTIAKLIFIVLRIFSTIEYFLVFPMNFFLAKIGFADELLLIARKNSKHRIEESYG